MLQARVADLAFHDGSPEQTAALYGELLDRFRDDLDSDQVALATYRLGEAKRLLGDHAGAIAAAAIHSTKRLPFRVTQGARPYVTGVTQR